MTSFSNYSERLLSFCLLLLQTTILAYEHFPALPIIRLVRNITERNKDNIGAFQPVQNFYYILLVF